MKPDYKYVPFCSNCGQRVEDKRHEGDEGVGPYCPGCGQPFVLGPTKGCVFCGCVAALAGKS